MVVLASLLSLVTYKLDRKYDYKVNRAPDWLVDNDPAGARLFLSTIATSIMTVAGVVFSVIIVALTLAASRYGPQLVPSFLGDTGNQIVLGTFLATFVYALLVLRTVRSEGDVFVPQISLSLSFLFMGASLIAFIYFVDHAAQTIYITPNITEVHGDLIELIDQTYPDTQGDESSEMSEDGAALPARFEEQSQSVAAANGGYVQALAMTELLRIGREQDLVVRVERRPGDFVVQGQELARVWPGERLSAELAAEIHDLFILAESRDQTQDVLFPLTQLVQVAVQALSPGINDPFTAMTVIDWLGDALCHAAGRQTPSRYHYGEGGELRVITRPVTFAELTDQTFTEIRRYGRSDRVVTIRLLETIGTVSACTAKEEERAALREQARLIWSASQDGLPDSEDRQAVEVVFEETMELLGSANDGAAQP